MGGGGKSSSASGFQGFCGTSFRCGATILGKNKKFAFTLAEVLITLGIIGVVAAMTLPSLIQNYKQKQFEAGLKKAYSQLSQVIQRVVSEDYGGNIELTPYNFSVYVANIRKYYKKASSCMWNCPDSGVFPKLSGAIEACDWLKKTYTTYNGNTAAECLGNDAMMALTDGSFLFFDNDIRLESPNLVIVDLNGWRGKPNRYGYDVFAFEVLPNGKVIPEGMENTKYTDCDKTSTQTNNGLGCTAEALNSTNYFKNLN